MSAAAAERSTITSDLDDRERISRFVRDFYRDVAQDDLLGPIFAGAHVDWPSHLDKLTDFWAWQLLGEPGYEGNPLRAHEPIDAMRPFTDEHFQRWLDLFTETVDLNYRGPQAELAKHRAHLMARALRRLLRGVSERGDVAIRPVLAPRPARADAISPSPRCAEPHDGSHARRNDQ